MPLVDFRGSGESSESYTTIGFREANDVSAVMHYVQTAVAHSSVILFGQSMGAVAILRAVHEDGITPDAVIVEAVFDTMLNTVRHRFAAMGLPSSERRVARILGWRPSRVQRLST